MKREYSLKTEKLLEEKYWGDAIISQGVLL